MERFSKTRSGDDRTELGCASTPCNDLRRTQKRQRANRTNTSAKIAVGGGVLAVTSLIVAGAALANGGPFVIKYPNGDPAAKGILARLDPNLSPAHEERLRVLHEDLKINFANGWSHDDNTSQPPLVQVSANYAIENPTDREIEMDFGFPILRGIYVSRTSMMPRPAVHVHLDGRPLEATIISNSIIYGIIRQNAREVIEQAVAKNTALAELVADVRSTAADTTPGRRNNEGPDTHEGARQALAGYLRGRLKWDKRDVALMVEFASLELGKAETHPHDRPYYWGTPMTEYTLVEANLGPLSAIGEQKATQFFATLAACFDPAVAATYESIFTAWGGDVRERSVDLKTGETRPREISVDTAKMERETHFHSPWLVDDPTLYARVDYFDSNANISEAEKAACKTILKNLPVIFTYAPMNLLHYRATFAPHSVQTLTVSYSQYAYRDTREPESYQLAYVIHPASLWKDFGPINLEVGLPADVPFRAAVGAATHGRENHEVPTTSEQTGGSFDDRKVIHRATLNDKAGELFVAVDADAWKSVTYRASTYPEALQHAGP